MAESDLVRVADAREAMAAIVASRGLSVHESEGHYPQAVAELAWLIADAMRAERSKRDGKGHR